jgi:2-polyprenyl-6-methoxyphenol hydroxylase-like FAD-dependent oxidoreductase
MTAWYVEMHLAGSGLDDARFDALADALAEIDAVDPEVADADLTASLAAGRVTASMVVEADGVENAVRKTVATVQAAIHMTGDSTPRWEQLTNLPALSVRPAESVPA